MTGSRSANLIFTAILVSLVGCATSSGVVVNPNAQKATYQSAYIVVHGDTSADMDAKLEKEFLRHGFAVTSGADGKAASPTDLVVRYTDDWKWDLKMYLRALNLMIFDGKTNVLLATGDWKNSAFHGYYSEDKVMARVVDDTLAKITAK